MIVDAHYHLEQSIETVDLLLANMDRSGVDATCLIPPLVGPFRLGRHVQLLGQLMTRLTCSPMAGIGRFFYRRTVTSDGRFSIMGRRYDILRVPDNHLLQAPIEAFPGRLYGWVFVNPAEADAVAELQQYKSRPGWIGAKAHPFWHNYPVRRLDEVARWCQERELPLLVHLGPDRDRGDYMYLPDRHGHLQIIYAHAGVPFYRRLWEDLRHRDNLLIDLSNPIFVDGAVLKAAVDSMGPHRCIWGTDGPYDLRDRARSIAQIRKLPISEQEKGLILGGNILELIGHAAGS